MPISPNFIHNLFIVFSSFVPCFAVLIHRIPFLDNKYAFFIMTMPFFLSGMFLMVLNYDRFGIIVGLSAYARIVLFLYPLFIALSNVIFTFRFGVQQFSKTLAVSLMLSFLLTETHEIANYFYEYTGFFQVIQNTFHPLGNLYTVIVGYLLFKMLHLEKRIALPLIGLITLSSFIYYHFAYSLTFSPWIRLLQFLIFTLFFYKWGSFE